MDRDTAYRELRDLVDRALLSTSGDGSSARYSIVRRQILSVGSTRLITPVDLLVVRMREAGFLTNTDYREAFGVDRFAATAELAKWVAEGVLLREGERRGARYRPGPRWPPV